MAQGRLAAAGEWVLNEKRLVERAGLGEVRGPGHDTGPGIACGATYDGACDQTGQEPRSAGHRAAASLTAMDITIHASFLPHDDPDAALAFYRDALGFEVRGDVGQGTMRWITVGPPGQPGTSILLAPPATDPGITGDERRTIAEMMAKGTYGWILLAAADLDGTFEKVQASGAEVVQEPVNQPYGVRDCAFRDPAGNLIRIQERR
jgi:predicted enzyme related to lactoylglutathione lyase